MKRLRDYASFGNEGHINKFDVNFDPEWISEIKRRWRSPWRVPTVRVITLASRHFGERGKYTFKRVTYWNGGTKQKQDNGERVT